MSQTQTQHQESHFTTELRHLRREIKMLATRVKTQHLDPDIDLATQANSAPLMSRQEFERITETHDNLTLAYRHLEDAAMRLGKAIQAHDGGVSVYDKAEA